MISMIIPAKDEIYLQKTIESALSAAKGDIEIIAVCDGYWPDPIVKDEPRVKLIHHTQIGQRQSINEAAKIAKGKFIFKVDAHCKFDEGFDVKLAKDCEYDWTVIPRMYVLDADKWEPKLRKMHDFMYFNSPWAKEEPMRIKYYDAPMARAYNKEYQAYKKSEWVKGKICDTMASLGAAWFMHTQRFWDLGGLDENHAHWGQMGVEIACKTWLSGGRQVVNKNTWFSHQWRRTPPWRLSNEDVNKSRDYSIKFWTEGKWPLQKYPLEWIAEKFAPVPTWCDEEAKIKEEKEITTAFHHVFYHNWNKHKRTWLGVKHCKYPTDMMVHQQIIWENKPDVIIECGSYLGGGTLFFASMLDCVGKGQVIGIDRRKFKRRPHPRITYLTGGTTSTEVLSKVREIVGDKSCMVVLDSNHSRGHVKRELTRYANIVTPGQYMVVEDTYLNDHPIKPEWGPGPLEAVQWFLPRYTNFKDMKLEYRNLLSQHEGGWLRRMK